MNVSKKNNNTLKCRNCKKPFTPRHHAQKFCNEQCFLARRKPYQAKKRLENRKRELEDPGSVARRPLYRGKPTVWALERPAQALKMLKGREDVSGVVVHALEQRLAAMTAAKKASKSAKA